MLTNIIGQFEELISEKVNGKISGFDRIVFHGSIPRFNYLDGVMPFINANNLLTKDFSIWMKRQTKELVSTVNEYAIENCGNKILYLPSYNVNKEEIAHNQQKELNIESGLIGVWSCLEQGKSYRSRFGVNKPVLRHYSPRCNHLYMYFDHPLYGFMNIRLQTWFPYHIQICMNGREWLSRSLEQSNIEFQRKGNKFLHIDDYQQAQVLLDEQRNTNWVQLLNSFLEIAFPTMTQTLGDQSSYYWTLWQSEWATDYIFESQEFLQEIINTSIKYSFLNNTSDKVLRFLDKPTTKKGIPYKCCDVDITGKIRKYNDSACLRYTLNKNCVKMYMEQSTLRFESIINDPTQFKVFRHALGEPKTNPKKRRLLRKGVVDTPLRSIVSQEINNRFIASLNEIILDQPIQQLIDKVTEPHIKNKKRVRSLDLLGKDTELLRIMSNPAFTINGMTNKEIRMLIKDKKWAHKRTDKQLSAKITRHLKLLRNHSLIRKIPNRRAYFLTQKGNKLVHFICVLVNASSQQLMAIAA